MKIKATCGFCGKDFLAEQAVSSGGHCPWCGKAFTRDYTANLVRALEIADAAGEALEDALNQVADIEPHFDVDEATVLDPLRDALRAQRRHARA